MIDRVDTNEQGRVIISGFREYRHRGRVQGTRFPPGRTELSERNHIISTFVIPTSAFVIWKMTRYKVIPRARGLSLLREKKKRTYKTNKCNEKYKMNSWPGCSEHGSSLPTPKLWRREAQSKTWTPASFSQTKAKTVTESGRWNDWRVTFWIQHPTVSADRLKLWRR